MVEKSVRLVARREKTCTVLSSVAGSKQDYITSHFRKIMRKMSPAPSPGNSESDLSKLDMNTLKKQSKGRKASSKNKNRDSVSTDEKGAISPLPPSVEQTPEETKHSKSNRNSGELPKLHLKWTFA